MTSGDAAAAAWVEHLRTGGATPWRDWRTSPGPVPGTDAATRTLPGAAQLEVLRQVNAHDPVAGRLVADLVLHRPGPGRGPAELLLSGAGGADGADLARPATPRVAAVDPEAVPPGVLLRVGAGVLADLVRSLPTETVGGCVGEPDAQPAQRPQTGLRDLLPSGRSSTPGFALVGPPRTLERLRQGLAVRGLHEHRPRPSWRSGRPPTAPDLVLVVLASVEDLLAEAWEQRIRRHASARGWRRFVRDWRGRDALPPGADLVTQLRRWTDRVPADRIRLVGPDGLDSQVRRLLGVRPGVTSDVSAGRSAPVLLDVLRRYHAVQNLHLAPAGRQAHTDLLLAHLADLDGRFTGRARSLGVPAGSRPWVEETGALMAAELGRYAGPGDPSVLSHVAPDRPRRLDHADVWPVMVEVIAAVAVRRQEVPR